MNKNWIFYLLLIVVLGFSCKREREKYCVHKAHWDWLDTCVDMKSLNEFIKDTCIAEPDRFNGDSKRCIELINSILKSRNEDVNNYYVESIRKISNTKTAVSVKHRDSYVYDYVLHGGIPPIIGNVSGKDRLFEIDLSENKIIGEYFSQ